MSNDHLPAPSCLTASEAQTLAIAVSELNRTVVDLRVSAAEKAIQIRQMSDQLKEEVSDINSLKSISDQNKGEKTIIATISVFVGGIISALISWWIQK